MAMRSTKNISPRLRSSSNADTIWIMDRKTMNLMNKMTTKRKPENAIVKAKTRSTLWSMPSKITRIGPKKRCWRFQSGQDLRMRRCTSGAGTKRGKSTVYKKQSACVRSNTWSIKKTWKTSKWKLNAGDKRFDWQRWTRHKGHPSTKVALCNIKITCPYLAVSDIPIKLHKRTKAAKPRFHNKSKITWKCGRRRIIK